MRSFAVADKFKSVGIGNELWNRLIEKVETGVVKTFQLITTIAEGVFYKKKGFEFADKSSAPVSIKQTTEFSTMCPAHSIYMILKCR